MGVDDQGNPFTLSPDPMLDTLRPYISGIKLGDAVDDALPKPILENSTIFGVNLYKVGLASCMPLFPGNDSRMRCGEATLEKYI